jgi:hypothetical protein
VISRGDLDGRQSTWIARLHLGRAAPYLGSVCLVLVMRPRRGLPLICQSGWRVRQSSAGGGFAACDSVTDLAREVCSDWDYPGLWQERAPLGLARTVSRKDFWI